MQAIRCILHLGQQSTVKVYSYIITDSFNTKQLIKNIKKALPEITTQLNMSLFDSTSENDSISLDCWVWNSDYLISCITDELANSLPKDILLKDDDLITALFYSAKDGIMALWFMIAPLTIKPAPDSLLCTFRFFHKLFCTI